MDARTLVRRLRFQQLELLCAVALHGSLGAAATRMRLSRPALSKGISELEEVFGLPLFERSAKGMRPTATGERIVRHARLLLHEVGRFEEEVRAATEPSRRVLRLGMPAYLAGRLAHELFGGLRRSADYSDMRVRVVEGRVAAHVEKMMAGELDGVLALYMPMSVHPLDLAALNVDHLRPEKMIVLGSSTLNLPRRRPVSWDEMAALPWILPDTSTHLRRSVDEMFIAQGVAPPPPAIESPDVIAAAHMAAAGLGITVVPEGVVKLLTPAVSVHAVRVKQPLPDTTITLLYRSNPEIDTGWAVLLRRAFSR